MSNILSINNHINFILICSKRELLPKHIDYIISYISNKKFNINKTISLAIRHGVLPLVYKNIKDISKNEKYFNTLKDFLNVLKLNYIEIVQKNMRLTNELIKIIDLFKQHKIKNISFKGAVLSQLAYGDITQRQYNDLDILIDKKNIYEVLELLKNIGYELEIVLKENTQETFFNSVNVVGLFKREPFIYIEIHWELLSKNYALKWDNTIWNSISSTYINNSKIPTLWVENHLLYLCVHGSKHFFERVEWVCDIDRFIKSHHNLNWSTLLAKSQNMGIERIFLLSLLLTHKLFNLELSESIYLAINRDKQIDIIINKIIDISFTNVQSKKRDYTTLLMLVSMREKPIDKFRLILYSIFSTKFDDFKFIQLANSLSFLYVFIRPYRLIKKYFYKSM